MGKLFKLRNAKDADMRLLNTYAYAEGMDNLPSTKHVRVAANADNAPVGFLRVERCDDKRSYINPMVTYEQWRGQGVGRALVEDALQREGELWLVSRGSSIGFYRALGAEDVAWEEIHAAIASDCDGCPMRDECKPQPMHLFLQETQKQ